MSEFDPIDEYVDDKGRTWRKYARLCGIDGMWVNYYAQHPTTGKIYGDAGGEFVKFPGVGSVKTSALYSWLHPSEGFYFAHVKEPKCPSPTNP